jgi:hypothetical protein
MDRHLNDRVADIRQADEAGTKNKLALVDEGTYVRFGIDLRQSGMVVSAGVDVHADDLVAIRDMLNTVIYRYAAKEG